MPFFIKGKRSRGGKSAPTNNSLPKRRKPPPNGKQFEDDEEISSDSEEDVKINKDYTHSSDEEAAAETVQEKRIRLANKYLEEIAIEEKKRLEADEEVDTDVIAARLREDALEQAGKLRKTLAASIVGHEEPIYLRCKEHSRTITCVIVSLDNELIFSASDDYTIVKWSLPERRKLQVIKRGGEKGHKRKILSLALSSDKKFLVSGDAEAKIHVWLSADLSHVHTFAGHKKDVTGLVFRKDTHQLFSCSSDKTIKIWSLDEMMYVETLYGHQCGIAGVDALSRDRAITAGGRDNTLRIWKVPEESHLVLNGHKEALDCVKLLDEDHVVTGGEDGYICIWSSLKKKPVFSLPDAHGPNAWVISVGSCVYTDLFASGSHTGFIQIYKIGAGFKSFERLLSVPVQGNINSLTFTSDGMTVVAGVGREHRLGRWTNVNNAKNSIAIIRLKKGQS